MILSCEEGSWGSVHGKDGFNILIESFASWYSCICINPISCKPVSLNYSPTNIPSKSDSILMVWCWGKTPFVFSHLWLLSRKALLRPMHSSLGLDSLCPEASVVPGDAQPSSGGRELSQDSCPQPRDELRFQSPKSSSLPWYNLAVTLKWKRLPWSWSEKRNFI